MLDNEFKLNRGKIKKRIADGEIRLISPKDFEESPWPRI
jgi:hypothetical protein